MKPYYSDDLVTLYHGDCLEVTEWLAADVLVTDPPYGIDWQGTPGWTNAQGGGGHRSSGSALSIANDKDTKARDSAIEIWGDGLALIFGDVLRFQPSGAVHVLIYAKPVDAGIRGARGGRRKDIEAIYMLGKWPVGIGGITSVLRTGGRVAGPRGMGLRAGHPHAKPIDVMQELIEMADGVVADPFAGSGTTLIAARNLGRQAIGVELEERYCELIATRLSQQTFDLGALV
jgi:DNA modification methylase